MKLLNTPQLEQSEFRVKEAMLRARYLFFLMTCIACVNCIVRSDYNFAFGLLGYYMIKSANFKKIRRTATTVSDLFEKTCLQP